MQKYVKLIKINQKANLEKMSTEKDAHVLTY